MARGRPRKKVEPEGSLKATITLNGEEIIGEGPFEIRNGWPEPEPEAPIKDDLVTLFEAARILNVDESTVKLYFDNGILTGQGQYGNIRISRGSLFGARVKKLISRPMG